MGTVRNEEIGEPLPWGFLHVEARSKVKLALTTGFNLPDRCVHAQAYGRREER